MLDGDTAFYAKIAKNIYKTGDWLTLRFVHEGDIIDKPPLFMWLTALSFFLFKVNEFALSLWHSIMAVLTVLFTYLLGRDLFSKRVGIYSAMILLTSGMFFYLSRTPLMDIPLTFFILLSLYMFIKFEKDKKIIFLYLSSLFAALGTLMKGPVGLAIPILTILIYVSWNRVKLFDKPKDYFIHIPLLILLFLIIVMPWFITEYLILGKRFISLFFERHFGRYLHPTDSLPRSEAKPQFDFYSYALQLFLLFAPWSSFLYPALYYSFKRVEKRKELSFIAIFALVSILFFSFSLNYKISRYILPSFPPLAILIGTLFVDCLEGKNKLSKLLVIISSSLNLFLIAPLLLFSTIWLAVTFPKEQAGYQPIVIPFLICFFLTIIIGSFLILIKKYSIGFFTIFFGTVISILIVINLLAAYIGEANPIKTYSLKLNELAKQGNIIIKFKGEEPRHEYFYIDEKFEYVTDPARLYKLTKENKTIYGIAMDINDLRAFEKRYNKKFDILESKGLYILFRLR
ncbi:MAG: glycosyltransferase family 39 protein [Candidatus Nanoarchaeia archaeon]